MRYCPLLVGLTFVCGTALHAAPPAVDFGRDIAPLLAKHCAVCHGPDKQEAGLRLDERAAALHGGDSGPVLVAGKSAESELLRRISAQDPDERMPPAERGPGLA